MNTLNKLFATACAVFGLALTAGPALATVSADVPEPGVLSLLGVGGVIAFALYIRRRRK